jgi:DNA-binding response OmpR family regulator
MAPSPNLSIHGWSKLVPEILLIDDDQEVRETITEALYEWRDANVTCAFDGISGAAMLRERHFDLALIDGILRGLSGIQLAHVAAAENTPVLILSGDPDINLAAEAAGIAYLPKPFSINELLRRSSAALTHGRTAPAV